MVRGFEASIKCHLPCSFLVSFSISFYHANSLYLGLCTHHQFQISHFRSISSLTQPSNKKKPRNNNIESQWMIGHAASRGSLNQNAAGYHLSFHHVTHRLAIVLFTHATTHPASRYHSGKLINFNIDDLPPYQITNQPYSLIFLHPYHTYPD